MKDDTGCRLDEFTAISADEADFQFGKTAGVMSAIVRHPRSVSQAVLASPPAHPINNSSASAINSTSVSRIYRYSSGAWGVTGTRSVVTDANGAAVSKQTGVTSDFETIMWGPRFGAIGGDATNQFVEVGFALAAGASQARIHIKVDDVLYTVLPEDITHTSAAVALTGGTAYSLQLPLLAGETKIFEVLGSRWRINYVRVPTATVLFPVNDSRYRITCFGASFVASDYSWVQTIGRLAGAEVFQCGVAGTGFLNPGDTGNISSDGGVYNTAARWNKLVATQPDLVILECSGNDSAYPSAGNFPALRDAKIAWLDQYATRLPNTRLIVIDTPPRGYTDSIADKTAINLASTRAAINARPNINIIGYHDYIGTIPSTPLYSTFVGSGVSVGTRTIASGAIWECVNTVLPPDGGSQTGAPTTLNTRDWRMFGWYTGTGRVGATVGNGNRDFLMGAGLDETHPVPIGYRAEATVMWPDILADIVRDQRVPALARATG